MSQYIRCDRCGTEYHDTPSVEMAQKMAPEWAKDCEKDGVKARGLFPCPNIACPGEMVMKGEP